MLYVTAFYLVSALSSLFVLIFLLTLAYRFVKAHERLADSLERMARGPRREGRDPLP